MGVIIADAEDKELPVVYANRRFERMTGYSKEATEAKNCRFLQGRDTDPTAVSEIREALSAREPVTTELLNYRADGTPSGTSSRWRRSAGRAASPSPTSSASSGTSPRASAATGCCPFSIRCSVTTSVMT